MTTLHACTALHSLHCTKCESPSTYVRRAEQGFLPCGSEDKAEAWKGVARGTLWRSRVWAVFGLLVT